jgi:sulfonate transport system substrate-binding protein
VTDDIARSQQGVADAFYGAHLIPRKITVRDNVWQNSEVAASLATK